MKFKPSLTVKILSLISLVAITQAANAESIGFNYQGYVPPLAANETAGVVPQNNYNNLGDTLSYSNLVNNSGVATSLDLNYTTDGHGFYVYSTNYPTTPNEKLVGSFVYSLPGNAVDVSLTSIPYTTYDLYLYGMSDTPGRVQGFTVTLSDSSTISFYYQSADKNVVITGSNNDPFSLGTGTSVATATANADYVVFHGLTDPNIIVSAIAYNSTSSTTPDSYSFFAGGQIVAVPEGNTWAMVLIGLSGVFLARKMRRPSQDARS